MEPNGHYQETQENFTEFPVYSIPEAEKNHMVLPTKQPTVDYSHMIAIIATWRDILNTRLLALLSLAGAMIGFGFCMYQPDSLRLWGLAIYSVLCVWPVMALYHRKG